MSEKNPSSEKEKRDISTDHTASPSLSSAMAADVTCEELVERLADTINPDNGAGMIGFRQTGQGAIGKTVYIKARERITPADFGAIGDGILHPLLERFDTLSEAQAQYPGVSITSLQQSIDWVAWKAFLNHLALNGGNAYADYGQWVLDQPLSTETLQKPFQLIGYGGKSSRFLFRSSVAGSILVLNRPKGVIVEGIGIHGNRTIDGTANHAFALARPINCKIIRCEAEDYGSAAFYFNGFQSPDLHYGNTVDNCFGDGADVGNNGVLFSEIGKSYIRSTVIQHLAIPGTPSYGIQFKGKCFECIGEGNAVISAVGGHVFADEGGGAGDGPIGCHHIGGTAVNCRYGALSGKATECSFNLADINHSGRDEGRPISISGNNADLYVRVDQVRNLGPTVPVINSRSSDITFSIGRWDGTGQYLINAEVGARNRLFIEDIKGTGGDLDSMINVEGSAERPLVYFSQTGSFVSVGTSSVLRLQSRSSSAARIGYGHTSEMFYFRSKSGSVDDFQVRPTDIRDGTDNRKSLGASNRRWTQVFAASGAINTSDMREKTDIEDIPEAVLRAWGKLRYRTFRFTDAVRKKGKHARIHAGLVAQEIKEAFESEGLDPFAYGLLCYDEWPDEFEEDPAEYDDNGNLVQEAKRHLITPAGSRYGIRYDEVACIEAAYIRWQLSKITSSIFK